MAWYPREMGIDNGKYIAFNPFLYLNLNNSRQSKGSRRNLESIPEFFSLCYFVFDSRENLAKCIFALLCLRCLGPVSTQGEAEVIASDH